MTEDIPAAARPVIGVVPPGAHHERTCLFDGLEQALDVQFVPRRQGEERGLDGLIVLDKHASEPQRGHLPSLTIVDHPESAGGRRPIYLRDEQCLDRRLRALSIDQRGAASVPGLAPSQAERVIATEDNRPVWVADRGEIIRHVAAIAPQELSTQEVLRDRLCDGRFLALLPIVELARHFARLRGWQHPPVRACFLFDDPNLHWPSYGHIKFAQVAQGGIERGYHVAMATVPLDSWFVHPRARTAFMRNPEALSLIVHGNEHIRHELARDRSIEDAVAVASQALTRIKALEARSGLTVDRIMAPPHGVCSETMAAGLLGSGFEALTVSRRHPWLPSPPSNLPLSGWWPGEFVAGGLTVLERRPFDTGLAELALMAYLDHPLILYGHHRDVADGLGRLRSMRDALAALGPVRWESLGQIARSNVSVRRVADALYVRMYSRQADVEVPDGVCRLVVDLPGHQEPNRETILCGDDSFSSGQMVPVQPGSGYRLRLRNERQADSMPANRRAAPLWPVCRRLMTETRDRSLTIMDRLAS